MIGNQIKGGFGLAVVIAVIVWILVFAALLYSPTELGQDMRRGWSDFRRTAFASDSSADRPDVSRDEEETPSPTDIEDEPPDPESPDVLPPVPSNYPDSTPSRPHSPANQPGDSPSQPGVLPPGETSPSRDTPSGKPDDGETGPKGEPLHHPDGDKMTPPNPDDPPTRKKKKVLDIPGWFTIFIPEEKPTQRAKNTVKPGSFTVPRPDGPVPDKKPETNPGSTNPPKPKDGPEKKGT